MAAAILSSVFSMITNLEAQSSLYPSESTLNDLNQLKRTVLTIQAVIHDAEERERRDYAVKHWVKDLKDVLYIAEDALDEYQFLLQSTPLEEVCDSTLPPFRDDEAFKINSIIEALNELASRCETLDLRAGEGLLDAEVTPLPTPSHVEEMVVYGREEDRKRVIELLLSDQISNNNQSVVSIVGIGGIGKSTLAQLVYNDPMVIEHFDARGWVCVSEDFNLVRLLAAILVSLLEIPCFNSELISLHREMKEELKRKRFLLVLDDVWNEDQSLWEYLRVCLVGLKGSVVLVTSRNESVARIMQTVPSYCLERLSEVDCWSLFRECAFGSSREPSAHLNLVKIGKGITKKLRGLPLAAKMIGSLLASETNERIWQTIFHSDLWDSGDAISPALTLSFHSLHAHLKRCFAYAALLPKDYLFKRDPLVHLWMAEGFIPPKEGKWLEDVGIEYFDELFRRSFFQYSQIDRETFVMHDLVHDLAQCISGKETCRIHDGNMCSITSEARVISLIPQDFGAEIQIESSYEPRGVRTFILMNRLRSTCAVDSLLSRNRLHLQIPNDLFINLKGLRTLDLSETDIEELPDSIAILKHLRFLALNHTKIRTLPESICSLWNLQTLEMRDCTKLVKLPRDIRNLINLRHLLLPRWSASVPMPHGIGLLTNLQTLTPFYVGSDEPRVIEELKHLVNLRGELVIGGLENVTNLDCAREALKNKEYITSLVLQSGLKYFEEEPSSYDYSIFDGEVEDFLLAPLFGDNSSLDDELYNCNSNFLDDEIEKITSKEEIGNPNVLDDGVGQKVHPKKKNANSQKFLRNFEEEPGRYKYDYSIFDGEVEDFLLAPMFDGDNSDVMDDGVEQKAHHEEEICKTNLVNDWVEHIATKKKKVPKKVVEDVEEGIFECLQPHKNIRELVIQAYHSLSFPSWLGDPSFSELVSLRLDNFWTCKALPSLGQLPFLRHLVIQDFPELETIGHEFYGQYSMVTDKMFPSLETLHFVNMFKWVEWFGVEDGGFPRLHQLDLCCCPRLRNMPHCLTSVKKLVVRSCNELRVLPTLPLLTHLEVVGDNNDEIWTSLSQQLHAGLYFLKIHGCRNLASFPLHKIYALKELEISHCQDQASSCLSLLQQLSNLTSLKHLKIHYCSEIRFSGNLQLPSTLQLLDILRCPLITEWFQGDGISKFFHIPRVVLDWKDISQFDKVDIDRSV